MEEEDNSIQFQISPTGKKRMVMLSVLIGGIAYKCMKHVVTKHIDSINRVLREYDNEQE